MEFFYKIGKFMLVKHKTKVFFVAACSVTAIAGYFSYPILMKLHQAPPQSVLPTQTAAALPHLCIYPYVEGESDTFDVGFKKWVLVLDSFPESEIPICEIKRLVQSNTEEGALSTETWYEVPLEKKPYSASTPPTMIISERGFLPGEKVFFRIKPQNSTKYEMISFYPSPLVLQDTDGKELAVAELTTIIPTAYTLHIPFDATNKLWRLQVITDEEAANQFMLQEEYLHILCSLKPTKTEGGFALAKLSYQDGTSHELKLPWGEKFNSYVSAETQTSD
jgi:hypothetical protein